MAKRSKDTLTGGTHDVNPQYLQGAVQITVANTPVETTIALPILRPGVGSSPSKAQVVEVLRLEMSSPGAIATDLAGAAALATYVETFTVSTTAQTTAVPNLSNPKVIAQFRRLFTSAFTAAGTYSQAGGVLQHQTWDFTDGAGHGILIGTDNLYFQYDTDGFASLPLATFKLLYRFKEVSLIEYIGMVQSQNA